MKVLIGIVLVASLALTGCATTGQSPQATATQQASSDRVNNAYAAYKTDKIKEYVVLQIMYEEYARHGITTMMKATSKAIIAAKAYEAGKIPKAEYEAAGREAQIALEEHLQALARQSQRQQQYKKQQFASNLRAVGQGMQAFGNGFNGGRIRMNCMTTGTGNMRMTNCY